MIYDIRRAPIGQRTHRVSTSMSVLKPGEFRTSYFTGTWSECKVWQTVNNMTDCTEVETNVLGA